MTTENSQTETATQDSANLPKYTVKVRNGHGKQAFYERIGVAWDNKDGSIYVKLTGTQVIDKGFTLYEITTRDKGEE